MNKSNWYSNTQCKQCHNIIEKNGNRTRRGTLVNGKEQRVCVVCGADRGLECFTKNPTRKDGFNYICDYCNESMPNHKNPERFLEHTINIPCREQVSSQQYITTFEQRGCNTYSRSFGRAIKSYNEYRYKMGICGSPIDYEIANYNNFFKIVTFDIEPGTFLKLPEQVKTFFQQCIEDRQHEKDVNPLDGTIHRCFYCGAIAHRLASGQYVCIEHKSLRSCKQCGKMYPSQWFSKSSEKYVNYVHIGCELENNATQKQFKLNSDGLIPYDRIKYTELKKAVMSLNENGILENNIRHVAVKGPKLYDEFISTIEKLSEDDQLKLPDDVIDFYNYALGEEIESLMVDETNINKSIILNEKVSEEALIKTVTPPRQVVKFEDEPAILKHLLISNGITQREAARAINIRQPTLNTKLNNKMAMGDKNGLALYEFIKDRVGDIPYKIERFESNTLTKQIYEERNEIDQELVSSDVVIEMKKCSGCARELPISEFHNRNASKDGLNAKCKSCRLVAIKDSQKRVTSVKDLSVGSEPSDVVINNSDAKKSNDNFWRCSQCDCIMPYQQYKNNNICDVCLKKPTMKKHWDGSYMPMFEQAEAPYYFKMLSEAWKAFENIKGKEHTSKYLRKILAVQYNCKIYNSREMSSAVLMYGVLYDIPEKVILPKILHDFFIMYMLDRIQEKADPFDITIKRCKYCGMPATDINKANRSERTCNFHKDTRTCTICNTLHTPNWGNSRISCPTCFSKSEINDALLTEGFTITKKGSNKYHLHSKHPSIPSSDVIGDRSFANELARSLAREHIISKLNRVISYKRPELLEMKDEEKQLTNISDRYAAEAQVTKESVKTITEIKLHSNPLPTDGLLSPNASLIDGESLAVCVEKDNTSPKDKIKVFIDTTREAAKTYILDSANVGSVGHKNIRILALKIWQELEAVELELEKEMVDNVTHTETYNKDSVNFYMKELALPEKEAIKLASTNTLATNNTYLKQ